MKTPHIRKPAAGFSLIEVMVAVLVISVGLLGIAKMQALALSNTNTSRLRSIAAIEAASFASAMHSNREYWGAVTNFSLTVSGAGLVVSSDAALNGAALNTLQSGCIATAVTTTVTCTPAQLAAFDLSRWWLGPPVAGVSMSSVYGALPAPIVTVSCPGVAGNLQPVSCTIVITWSEKGVSMNSAETAQEAANQLAGTPSAFERPSFMLYVEP